MHSSAFYPRKTWREIVNQRHTTPCPPCVDLPIRPDPESGAQPRAASAAWTEKPLAAGSAHRRNVNGKQYCVDVGATSI